MTAIIEAARRRFGWGLKHEQPQFEPHSFEPVTDQEKVWLKAECNDLIGKDNFDGADFNLFVSDMIKLLGGERQTPIKELSQPLVDQDAERAIYLQKITGKGENQVVIQTAPRWVLSSDEQLKHAMDNLKEFATMETVEYKWFHNQHILDAEGNFFTDIHIFVLDPLDYSPASIQSYSKGDEPIELDIDRTIKEELTAQETQKLCARIFSAYEKQSHSHPNT